MFNTKYSVDTSSLFSVSGSPETEIYKIEVDSYGCDVLCRCGTHDLYAEIQSYHDDTDLLRVLSLLPEISKPNFTDNIVDLTKIPRTLGNWFNFNHDLNLFWDSLSASEKLEIGNIKNLPDYLQKKALDNNNLADSIVDNNSSVDSNVLNKGGADNE